LILTASLFAVAAVGTAVVATNSNDEKSLLAKNVQALASGEEDPCPNGCYDDGEGCWCNGWHEHYKEAGNN
jgi:hypothetical protein